MLFIGFGLLEELKVAFVTLTKISFINNLLHRLYMALDAWNLTPFMATLSNTVLDTFPKLFLATFILFVGYLVGKLVSSIFSRVLMQIKLNEYVQAGEHFKFEVAHVFSFAARWIIYLVFIGGAFDVVGNQALVTFFGTLVGFFLSILQAGGIIIISFVLGVYIKDNIIGGQTHHSDLVGKVIMYASLFLGISIGLEVALPGKATLAADILRILVGSAGLGIALAIGLGLKDVVSKMAEDYAGEFKEKAAKHKASKK